MSHHHLPDLVAKLKQHGDRLTTNRLQLLKYLCQQQRPVSVKQIERALPKVNIVTLYRILEHWQNDGIVERLTHDPKEQYFEIASPYHQHHHHTVCQHCGKVTDIECELKLPNFKNFVPSMHVVTVYGWCQTCLKSLTHDLP